MFPIRYPTLAGAALLFGATVAFAANPASQDAKIQDAQIHVDNFTFGPATLTVASGTRVTWTNRDDIPHTVVDAGEPRQMKSPPLDTGEHFEHVFETPGTFHYFCSVHPKMEGTVIVK